MSSPLVEEHLQRVLEAARGFLYLLRPGEDGGHGCLWMSAGVRTLLGYEPEEAMRPGWFADGLHPADRQGPAGDNLPGPGDGPSVREFRFRRREGGYRWFREELRSLDDGDVVGIAMDITRRKKAERERERVIRELREALAEVEKLRRILPICAACKKVRDDEGYWHRVESYFRSRGGVEFSHGICPECSEALYGELGTDRDDG